MKTNFIVLQKTCQKYYLSNYFGYISEAIHHQRVRPITRGGCGPVVQPVVLHMSLLVFTTVRWEGGE